MLNRLFFLALLTFCEPSWADSLSLQSLYTNPQNKTLPEIIIFHNTANPCENCQKTIDMIISVLRKNYQKKITAYLLDEQKHPAFISAFHLKGPLTLVAVRISDGASFGYEKLEGLPAKIYDKQEFSRTITEFIDNFLDLNIKN